MNRFSQLVLVSLFLSGLLGCALNQPIRYNMSDIAPSGMTELKGITLSVEPFSDSRTLVRENGIVFTAGRETRIDGKKVCINSEEHYNKEPVASQITAAVSEHLKQRAAFKEVLVNSKNSADFQLQGSIRQFYSQQNFSYAAAVGSQFGLIGALVTMNAKTLGTIKIEFTDLRILDRDGNQVKALESIVKTFENELPADAYCWQAFWNANSKLRLVVDLLAENVEKGLSEIVSTKTNQSKNVNHSN